MSSSFDGELIYVLALETLRVAAIVGGLILLVSLERNS